MNEFKKIRLLKQDRLTEIDEKGVEHSVTNNPGAELDLPIDEADAKIAAGIAVEVTADEVAAEDEVATAQGGDRFAGNGQGSDEVAQ